MASDNVGEQTFAVDLNEYEQPNARDEDQLHGELEPTAAVDIVVYFAENSGLHLKVVDGQNANASELFEMVMEEQKYSTSARELFSLWLVSDLLELQLKPSHIPFKLVCYWEELLEKYSAAPLFERQRDEPVIMFRRNVFCSIAMEKELLSKMKPEDQRYIDILSFLYGEAKKNVLTGRYPVSRDMCDKLAGIQAVIMHKLNERDGTVTSCSTLADFKSNMFEYLPAHFCKRRWLVNTKDNPEYHLLRSYQEQTNELREAGVETAYCKYIEICQELPYYGCAFFRGQVEHPGRRLLSARVDDPVYVAINMHGVYVVDEDDFVVLIGLPYKFFCWERAKSSEESGEHLPFLLLQFPVDNVQTNKNNSDTYLLQIFSKQTVMMDKLIEACVVLRKYDNIIASYDKNVEQRGVVEGMSDIAQRFKHLALKKV